MYPIPENLLRYYKRTGELPEVMVTQEHLDLSREAGIVPPRSEPGPYQIPENLREYVRLDKKMKTMSSAEVEEYNVKEKLRSLESEMHFYTEGIWFGITGATGCGAADMTLDSSKIARYHDIVNRIKSSV